MRELKNAYDLYPELATVRYGSLGAEHQHASYVIRNSRIGSLSHAVIIKNYQKYALVCTQDLRLSFTGLRDIFQNRSNPVVMDIGFGKGESTFEDALENKDVNFLCVDVYIQGFAALMRKAASAGLENIILCHHDAFDLLTRSISAESVDGFKILFPDPWPKRKHRKRRLISLQSEPVFSSRLRRGGFIHAATDDEDYARCILQALSADSSLRNEYDGFAPQGVRKNKTAYERKAIAEGRRAFDIIFRKI